MIQKRLSNSMHKRIVSNFRITWQSQIPFLYLQINSSVDSHRLIANKFGIKSCILARSSWPTASLNLRRSHCHNNFNFHNKSALILAFITKMEDVHDATSYWLAVYDSIKRESLLVYTLLYRLDAILSPNT